MTIGKNKKAGKSKKGGRKKATDPFARKEWYQVRTTATFGGKSLGNTVVTKTTGQKVARDGLLGRLFKVSLGDLKAEVEPEAHRIFNFRVEDVQGFNCLTSFAGMDITQDKLRSVIRKWQTTIECYVDVKTTDGFAVRLFALAATKRASNEQKRKTSYAQHAQVKAIRKRMVELITKEANCELNALVEKLSIDSIGKEIEKHCSAIYPLQNCMVRKVKMMRAPKVDLGKLAEGAGGLETLAATAAPTVVPVTASPLAQAKAEAKAKEQQEAKAKEQQDKKATTTTA